MQSASTNEMALTDMRRKISMMQQQIDRISQGEKPIATLMYLETTAVGVSEKAALDALSTQLNSLQISLSGLDVDLTRVIGRSCTRSSGSTSRCPLNSAISLRSSTSRADAHAQSLSNPSVRP